MVEDRFATLKLALAVIQTLGIVLAAASLVVALYGIRQQHEWNRREQALAIVSKFNTEMRPHKEAIFLAFPGINDAQNNQIPTQEECVTIIKARARAVKIVRNADAFDLRDHVLSVLNYFENLTIAWEYHIGDREIIEEATAPVILRWHKVFEPCMSEMNKEVGEEVWPSLQRVVTEWKGKRAKRPKTIAPTG